MRRTSTGGGWNKYAATAQNTQPHKYKQHKYENAQARKHINTQVYTYKKHIQKYTRKQAHKHIKKTNTQAHTYTNPQSHCQKILKRMYSLHIFSGNPWHV